MPLDSEMTCSLCKPRLIAESEYFAGVYTEILTDHPLAMARGRILQPKQGVVSLRSLAEFEAIHELVTTSNFGLSTRYFGHKAQYFGQRESETEAAVNTIYKTVDKR